MFHLRRVSSPPGIVTRLIKILFLTLEWVSEVQIGVISQLLKDFPRVFSSKLDLTNVLEYDIHLTDNIPVMSSPYRLSPPRMTVYASSYRIYWIRVSLDIMLLHTLALYFWFLREKLIFVQ